MSHDFFAVISEEASSSEIRSLKSEFEVYTLPPDTDIAFPVRSHPDMIMCIIDGHLILSEKYYLLNKPLIDEIASRGGLTVVPSGARRYSKYPYDVGFNVTLHRDKLICNPKYTAPEILAIAEKNGISVIPVSQGYAGCSCLSSNDFVITSDIGIHGKLVDYGIESLFVSNKGISLPGYDVGLIGGCGGICQSTVYLYGDIKGMELESPLTDYIKKKGYKMSHLPDSSLTDRGGIKFIPYPEK